jgi:hypothetical protein
LDGETLLGYVPEEFKEKLPGAKVIIDLTSFQLKSKANAAAGRILYSAYHHRSEAGAVFVIAGNGLFLYRSKLFGGISAEVLTIFNNSLLMERLKAHGVIPKEGLAPGIKVAVADTAYHRASNEWDGHIFLPQKLPENIDELSGDALRDTHIVQSFRGLIERMFAHLKKWEVLHGGSIEAISTKEMEVDVAMALANLNLRARLGLLDSIPARAKFALGAHIII